MTLILYLCGSVFDCIVVIMSNRIKNLYEEDDNEDESGNSVDNLSDSVYLSENGEVLYHL